jgi:hypothetical protein
MKKTKEMYGYSQRGKDWDGQHLTDDNIGTSLIKYSGKLYIAGNCGHGLVDLLDPKTMQVLDCVLITSIHLVRRPSEMLPLSEPYSITGDVAKTLLNALKIDSTDVRCVFLEIKPDELVTVRIERLVHSDEMHVLTSKLETYKVIPAEDVTIPKIPTGGSY